MIAEFLSSLERGDPATGILAEVGEPDPAKAAQGFSQALRLPELASCVDAWGPRLLLSARPGFGAHRLAELALRRREACGANLDPTRAPALAPLLGTSNFLARLLLRHPEWVDGLAGDPPAPLPDAPPAADWRAIRLAKYEGLLRIVARDVLGCPFEEILRDLSDLADRCLTAALERAAHETAVAPPALLALGKLGGRELNFSSDVDLLFVYETAGPEADLTRNREVAQLVQLLKRELETPTEDGFVYRVDLDLRPEGRDGVLANSVDALITYYESFGRDWERQMLIRLRTVVDAPPAAEAFARGIRPYVYSRHVGPDLLGSVRAMKSRIETEHRQAGRDLEADLKEGPGGIRDVEFLVQGLQLFYGGHHHELQTGNVLDALRGLARLGILGQEAASALSDSYTWLRRAEHALQVADERQTRRMPRAADEQVALARRMGYGESAGPRARARMLDDWTAVRTEVRSQFEALTLGGGNGSRP